MTTDPEQDLDGIEEEIGDDDEEEASPAAQPPFTVHGMVRAADDPTRMELGPACAVVEDMEDALVLAVTFASNVDRFDAYLIRDADGQWGPMTFPDVVQAARAYQDQVWRVAWLQALHKLGIAGSVSSPEEPEQIAASATELGQVLAVLSRDQQAQAWEGAAASVTAGQGYTPGGGRYPDKKKSPKKGGGGAA